MAARKTKLGIEEMCTVQSESGHQFSFLDNYYKYDVHLLLGYPGTGKTFLAFYRALEDVLEASSPFEKVLIIRSAVSSRDIGFTPGDKEEKSSLYEKPYIKMAKDLFRKDYAYALLKEQKVVEFDISSFLRGETFDNTVIVVDEIQNMTYIELYTIITRVGINSKILFCGDERQNDIGNKSGYRQFVNVVQNMPSCHKVVFNDIEDIVRGGIIKEFIISEMNSI